MAERAKAKSAASAAGRTGSGTASGTGKKAATTKAAKGAAKTGAAKTRAAKTENEGETMAKSAATKTTGARGATKRAAKSTQAAKSSPAAGDGNQKGAGGTATKGRSAAETERIRVALKERSTELHEEYEQHLVEIAELQRDRLTDSAGDDQADTGSKTFEREQEISLANSILERIKQVDRALERLEEGSYGWCERCGDAIPVERLAAFPSATLCVRCKQLEERR